MRDWSDKKGLVDKVAQAWRDAYATGPRDSNEHLEAAKFIAMFNAVVPLKEIFPDEADLADPLPGHHPSGEEVALPAPEMVTERIPEDGPAVQVEEPAPPPARIPLAEVDYANHSG